MMSAKLRELQRQADIERMEQLKDMLIELMQEARRGQPHFR